MTDNAQRDDNETEDEGGEGKKSTLSLSPRKTLELKSRQRVADVNQTFSHGRTNSVKVEVRRRRVISRDGSTPEEAETPQAAPGRGPASAPPPSREEILTDKERQARFKALEDAKKADEEARVRAAEEAMRAAEEAKNPKKDLRKDEARAAPAIDDEDEEGRSKVEKKVKKSEPSPRKATADNRWDDRRLQGKLTLSQLLAVEEEGERQRSQAAMRRAREKHKQREVKANEPLKPQVREVIIPEAITVQELSNRMAVQGSAVIKTLMKLGVMATINQVIDADTAELVVTEFGHKFKRVAESDVEIGLKGEEDRAEELAPRAPVVTVMGHVDHGKTSLLDALKKTDVAAREAGGITQHIGAYRVTLKGGQSITFIDTPGHAAFTEMRARGANVTDIVVLVVAADDGIMEQTVEAINHAKAAKVPIIVAINKMDKPDANPMRVRTELLSHEIVVEEMSGDVLSVEVSALKGTGLDKLEEAILLQAELMQLNANPDRKAEGTVIEAKLEQGRGSVATVLIQRGTLRPGDIFIAGSQWGKVRALIDDKGRQVTSAGPSEPVEVLGLNGTPVAGDEFVVADSEAQAREITSYRLRKEKEKTALATRSTVDQMLMQIKAGEVKDLPIILKTDVHGSLEAIKSMLDKLATEEVKARVISSSVGAINESDISLAAASKAQIVAFNVRANATAREIAKKEGVDIKYYSIIYNILEDVKAMLSGMLAPTVQEDFIGYAEVRQVFNVSKIGRVAGCFIKEGVVKRGAGVRLLRDNVVIHEGTLKTLKRFKDEVKEVREGYECGMAFEAYDDLKEGDVVECYERKEVIRTFETSPAKADKKK